MYQIEATATNQNQATGSLPSVLFLNFPTQGYYYPLLPLPEHWATYFVIFLVANPDYVRATPDQESVLTDAHIQYQLQLQEQTMINSLQNAEL